MLTDGRLVPVAQLHIARAARYMIDNHGSRASAVATKRADSLVSLGHDGPAATWRQIAAAIGRMRQSHLAANSN